MKSYLSAVCYLICGLLAAQQDLTRNYAPLRSAGQLPEVFTQDIRQVIKADISQLYKKKDKDNYLKSTFLTASNYQIEKIVRSGSALVNDEVTLYLNQLADVILKDNPALRKQLHIFTLKSPVVNAYSFDKGFIFVDIGLIAQVESEAQLAYILCHEITHYTRQHHINSYVTNAYIDRSGYPGADVEGKIIEKCQYSKENESEADIEGFKLYERTTYDLHQAEKGFDVLQYAHLPFELIEFKKSFFESPGYIIPDQYFLKDVSGIKDNSEEDDTRMTHPNTKKRKKAIAEIIANRDNTGRVKSVLGESRFEYIRDLSRMELCRLYLRRRDYLNALYGAYILAQKFPANEYVHEVIAKSLYGITLYSRNDISYSNESELEHGIPDYNDIESFPQQLYHMAQKMPSNELTILSLNRVFRDHLRFPQNKAITTISDSLFHLMKDTNWGISGFAKSKRASKDTVVLVGQDQADSVRRQPASKTEMIASLQRRQEVNSEDTMYYRDVFTDLFSNPEFAEKMPAHGNNNRQDNEYKVYTLHAGRRNMTNTSSNSPKGRTAEEIRVNKVLVVEPFYVKVDESERQEVQYMLADQKQEDFLKNIEVYAGKLKLQVEALDPGRVAETEVDKINDFAVMNDWFEEKFDTDREGQLILNTDVSPIIEKYGTRYVLKTGVISVRNIGGRKRTYFYGLLYDLQTNQLLYRKYDVFKTTDRRDMLNAKTYQMLYEINRPIRK